MHNCKVLTFATNHVARVHLIISFLHHTFHVSFVLIQHSADYESLPGRVLHDWMSKNGGYRGSIEGREVK